MENLKDIRKHQLQLGEVGLYKGVKYKAVARINPTCFGCAISRYNACDQPPGYVMPKCEGVIFKKVE